MLYEVITDRRGGRLPDRDVAHEGGRRREVAADRGEVERGDGVDEPFQWPVIHAVPLPRP